MNRLVERVNFLIRGAFDKSYSDENCSLNKL
jgi:hypothetical protein